MHDEAIDKPNPFKDLPKPEERARKAVPCPKDRDSFVHGWTCVECAGLRSAVARQIREAEDDVKGVIVEHMLGLTMKAAEEQSKVMLKMAHVFERGTKIVTGLSKAMEDAVKKEAPA